MQSCLLLDSRKASICCKLLQVAGARLPASIRGIQQRSSHPWVPTNIHQASLRTFASHQNLRWGVATSALQHPNSSSHSKPPSFTFKECCAEIVRIARANPRAKHIKAALAKLAEHNKPPCWWMVVECGVWKPKPQKAGQEAPEAPPGEIDQPARSVLLFTPTHSPFKKDPFDVAAFMLDKAGLPTGDAFLSPTAFEKYTSKRAFKKYRASCVILHRGQAWGHVNRFIDEVFGE